MRQTVRLVATEVRKPIHGNREEDGSTMNFRQLEAFCAVRDTGSTTLAASRLNVTQSTISRLILQLEEQIGYQLFDRQGSGLTLTPEGLDLSEIAERIMGEVERIEQMSRNIRQQSTRVLRVAAMPAIGTCMMPHVLRHFLDDVPNVHVKIELKPRPDVQALVINGKCDIGLVTLPLLDDSLRVEQLCQEEAVCIVPKGHRLVDQEKIALSDLEGERLISIGTHTILRYRLEEALSAAGIQLGSACEADSTILVANLVAARAGVGIVHRVVADMFADKLVARPLADPITLSYGIIQRRGSPTRPLTERLIASLRERLPLGLHCNPAAEIRA